MTVWAHVKDLTTGAHLCIGLARLQQLLARGAVVELAGRRHSGKPHPPKPRRPLGVGPSRRRRPL